MSQKFVAPVSVPTASIVHKHFQQNYLCHGAVIWHGYCKSTDPPSFLTSVRSPGLSRGIEPRGDRTVGGLVYKTLMTRAKMTAAISLLIAIVQFAGVGAVSISSGGPTSAEYYCCCPGECHCTADCCNHAPGSADAGASATPRVGAGSPILEAPNRCGVWTGTLNRSPNSPKALPAAERGQAAMRPELSFRRLPDSGPSVSSRATLRASAPRAPPISVDVT
jgi:hypothetical protein